jgi:hypothetical protein
VKLVTQATGLEVQLKRHTGAPPGSADHGPRNENDKNRNLSWTTRQIHLRPEKRECEESMEHEEKGKTDRARESTGISHVAYF